MSKLKLIPGSIVAEFQRNTYNSETRTIDVICTTDAPVVRHGWEGSYNEVLSMQEKHIRLERFSKGNAPLLDSHHRWELKDVIGVVERAWIEGNKLMATVRFSDRDSVKDIIKDVADGILKNLSIGYKIFKIEETKAESGKLPTYRAVDWEPFEVSFVAVPADPNATVRMDGDKNNVYEVEVIHARSQEDNNSTKSNSSTMPTEAELKAAADAAAEKERIEKEAAEKERKRAKDIRDAVKTFGLSEEFAESLVEKGTTIESARAEIQVEFSKADPNKGAKNRISVVGKGEKEKVRDAMIAGMVLRSGEVPSGSLSAEEIETGRSYRSLTLMDLAKKCLVAIGEDVEGLSKMEIAKRAISSSTSDFPILLEGTNRRVLLANYSIAADTWRKICAIGSVSDFREHKRLRMGSFSNLDELGEGSEYKNKKINDAQFERISAKTKGNIINVSRQMIINDDLAGFTRLSAMLGRASARSIEADVYELLLSNPKLEDGIDLFHSSHGNIISSGAGLGAPTVTNIDAMRQLMAIQKDPDNNDFLDIRPDILLTPIGLGGTARVVNDSQYDPDATNKLQRPNIVRGLFSEVVDTPRLSGSAYYSFADPNIEPVLEVVFLDGVQTPYMESMETFDVDGIKWKIRLDYGVGAVGFRGVVKNNGQ